MKTTRQKRPDRVICKWKNYYVELGEDKSIRRALNGTRKTAYGFIWKYY